MYALTQPNKPSAAASHQHSSLESRAPKGKALLWLCAPFPIARSPAARTRRVHLGLTGVQLDVRDGLRARLVEHVLVLFNVDETAKVTDWKIN
eukprot:3002415-Prymnesium_polylepis.1